MNLEIQRLCANGVRSDVLRLRQYQLDPQAEAACLPVNGLQHDLNARQIRWEARPDERFEVSLWQAGERRPVLMEVVNGAALSLKGASTTPTVSRVVRLCGEAQRSRATYLALD